MEQIRKRLTYANVMSSLAVFLVLGGASAFAAAQLGRNTVGPNQLKRNAVSAAKIEKGAVTRAKIKKNAINSSRVAKGSLRGSDLKLSTIGTVPSANTAGGQWFLSYSKEMAADAAALVLFDFGGVKFTATCPAGLPAIDATNTSGVKAAARSSMVTEVGGVFGNGQATFSTLPITNKEKLGGGTFEAAFEGGQVTSVSVAYRNDTFAGGGCRFFGHAISG